MEKSAVRLNDRGLTFGFIYCVKIVPDVPRRIEPVLTTS